MQKQRVKTNWLEGGGLSFLNELSMAAFPTGPTIKAVSRMGVCERGRG